MHTYIHANIYTNTHKCTYVSLSVFAPVSVSASVPAVSASTSVSVSVHVSVSVSVSASVSVSVSVSVPVPVLQPHWLMLFLLHYDKELKSSAGCSIYSYIYTYIYIYIYIARLEFLVCHDSIFLMCVCVCARPFNGWFNTLIKTARSAVAKKHGFFCAGSGARFWKRDISSASEKASPGVFDDFVGCSTASKERYFCTQQFTRFLSMVSSHRRITRPDLCF